MRYPRGAVIPHVQTARCCYGYEVHWPEMSVLDENTIRLSTRYAPRPFNFYSVYGVLIGNVQTLWGYSAILSLVPIIVFVFSIEVKWLFPLFISRVNSGKLLGANLNA